MLNASVGLQRVIGRVRRSPSSTLAAIAAPTRSRALPRDTRPEIAPYTVSSHLYPRPHRRRRRVAVPSVATVRALLSLRALRTVPIRSAFIGLGHERIVGLAAAGILLGASVLSVAPTRPTGDTGGPSGDAAAPRLAIAGSNDGDDVGSVEESYVQPTDRSTDAVASDGTVAYLGTEAAIPDVAPRTAVEPVVATVEGPFLDDGTLLKPVAVDTSVPDGSALMRTYKVKAGDTLAGIADRYDVSTMTLWWANKLKAKDQLVQGQVLRIPPVSGLVVEVKATDTLAGLASRYKLDEDEILATNGIEDRNLVVGQVLMLPGAKGAGIVAPKPRKTPSTPVGRSGGGSSGGSSGGTTTRPPRTYSGGNFAWPTSSRRISQYYHYGHFGIDIDGSTGDPIYAAASGTVTFAGWKSNGGGYQVWIAHGSGLYTTYNHMAGVSVGRGQGVDKGQRVGRMGATGNVTGSHLHFEVWKGSIWSGGSRVNPLGYL